MLCTSGVFVNQMVLYSIPDDNRLTKPPVWLIMPLPVGDAVFAMAVNVSMNASRESLLDTWELLL